jgi:hypothetical protein
MRGGDSVVGPDRRYALELDQAQVERYRMMAEAARQAEADLWERAGMVAGARAADVGPDGEVTAVAAATALVAAVASASRRSGRPGRRDGGEAGSLDVVMLRHVLAHNGGAEDAIVVHLATLLRPVAACTSPIPPAPTGQLRPEGPAESAR